MGHDTDATHPALAATISCLFAFVNPDSAAENSKVKERIRTMVSLVVPIVPLTDDR